MTALIIKSPAVLTAPRSDSLLISSYGLTGIAARYHADAPSEADGESVSSIYDMSGNDRTAEVTAGDITIGAVGGVRTFDFTASGTNTFQSSRFINPANRSLAVLAYVTNMPSFITFARTGEFAGSRVQLNMAGTQKFQTMGSGSGSYVETAGVAIGEWHAVIGTWDADTETGTITVDGVTTSGSIDYAAAPNTAIAHMSVPDTFGFHLREYIQVDHVMDATEISDVTAGLLAQVS